MPTEKVTADQVLGAVTGEGITVQPSFEVKAGFYLALAVFSLIIVVTILLVVQVWIHYPASPSIGVTGNSAAVDEYQKLSTLAVDNAKALFQTMVTQALLPVLTALLGYLFARHGRG